MSTTIITPAELVERSRARVPIYNPTDIARNLDVFGRTYHLPPDGECIVSDHLRHPRKKAQGGKVVTIFDEWEPEPGASALQVVSQILERYAHQGFIVLLGDELDEERKAEAREKYVAWRLEYAETIESAWIQRVAAFTAAQPGAPPPRQPKLIRAELAFLQKHRSGRLDRKDFLCSVCSSEFDTLEGPDGYDEHRRTAHPGLSRDVAPVRNPAAAAAAAEQVGVPGEETDAEDNRGLVGAVLVERALAVKVDLLKAELLGLLQDDPKTIDAVVRKVAEAEAAAKAKSKA